MARAAQRYGIVVRDRTHQRHGVLRRGPDAAPAAIPTGAATAYFGGTPADALAGFPWEHLQLLQMTLVHAGAVRGRAGGPVRTDP